MQETWRDQMIWGLFFGYLTLMILHNLFLWLSFKEKSYFYNIVFNFSYILFVFSHYGLSSQYIWGSYPEFNHVAGPILVASSLIALIVFSKFLATSKDVFITLEVRLCLTCKQSLHSRIHANLLPRTYQLFKS